MAIAKAPAVFPTCRRLKALSNNGVVATAPRSFQHPGIADYPGNDPQYIRRRIIARFNCERCGDTYDEDNLIECARCRDDTCWKCAIHAELPELAEGSWWCDRCLKAVGQAHLLKGQRYDPNKKNYGDLEKSRAVEALRGAVQKSNAGSLPWPEDVEERKKLTNALEVLGLDVGNDSEDFITPPGLMPPGVGELVFEGGAYWGFGLEFLKDRP